MNLILFFFLNFKYIKFFFIFKNYGIISEIENISKNWLITSHWGFSHLTSHIAAFGSAQLVWHLGGSHTGSQIAGQWGSSHFQAHWGWH